MKRKGIKGQKKSNKFRFLCNYCGNLFRMKHNLESHIVNCRKPCEKLKQSLFNCPHCEFYSKSLMRIKSHLLLFHKSNAEQDVSRAFICDYCNYVFKRKGHLVSHIQNIHIKNKDEMNNKCVSCDYCKSYFKNSIWLGRHITQCHMIKEENGKDKDAANDINNVLSNLEALNSQFQPDILAQAIGSSELALSPLNIVESKGENYKRNDKSDTLAQAIGISRLDIMPDIDISKLIVSRENGVNMIKCSLCSHKCHKLSLLKRHFVMHFKSESYRCPQCPATFRFLCKFKEHIKYHKPKPKSKNKAKPCHKKKVANVSQWEIKILEPTNELEKESSCLNTSFLSLDNTIFSVDDSILDNFMDDIPSDILPPNLNDIDLILNKRSISQNEYYKEYNQIEERISFRDYIVQSNPIEINGNNNINSTIYDTNEHSTFTINNNIQVEVIDCNEHNANIFIQDTSHALRDHDYIGDSSLEIDKDCISEINSIDETYGYNNILQPILYSVNNNDDNDDDINNKTDSSKQFYMSPNNAIKSYNYSCDMKSIFNSRTINNITESLTSISTTDENALQNIIPNVCAAEKPPITFMTTDPNNQADLNEITIAINNCKNAQLYPNAYSGSNINDKFAFTNIISTSINKINNNSNEIAICLQETSKDTHKDFLTSDTYYDCGNDSAALQPQWNNNTNTPIYHNLNEGNIEEIPSSILQQSDSCNIDDPSYILDNYVLPTHENHCDMDMIPPQNNAVDGLNCLNIDIMCYNIDQLQGTLNTERNLATDCNRPMLGADSSTDYRTDLNKNVEETMSNTNMEIDDYLSLNGRDVMQGPISMSTLDLMPDNVVALPCYATENVTCSLNHLNTTDNIENIMNEGGNIPETITQPTVQHCDYYEGTNIADIDPVKNKMLEDIPDSNIENNDKMMLKLLSQQSIKAFIKSDCEHVCGACFKRFYTNKNLKEHIQIVHGSLKFTCEHCGNTLHSKKALKVHIKSHFAPSKIKCQVCAKAVAPLAMTVHMRLHNNHAPFLCILCGKKFKNFTNKKQHIIKYHLKKESKSSKTTLMDMICEINEPEMLNDHKSVAVLKKYANDIIEKRDKKAFTKKLQSKTESEKVACEVCHKVYVNSEGLRRHSKLHTRPKVKCDLCDAEFENKKKLSMHKYRLHNPHKKC